jgi:amino acid adenylation domain-containing protein
VATPLLAPAERQGNRQPLSLAQDRVWLADRLAAGSALYNIPLGLRLRGTLPPHGAAAMAAALAEVVRRHEVLRTRVTLHSGGPAAVVLPPPGGPAAPLPLVDLSRLAPPARQAAAAALRAAEGARPFDLASGPPLRALLLRHDAGDHELLASVHHIAFDGGSVGIFGEELAALYRAAIAGQPSPLPEPALQYGDFATWQRRWLVPEVMAEHLAAWRDCLEGCSPVLDLPGDRPRPPVMSHRGERLPVALGDRVAAGLARLARQQRVTLFVTVSAGFAALLARYSGQHDFMLGIPVANRNRPQLERLIGFFVNTVVLRCDCAGDPDFARLLGRMRESAIDALAHQDLPFEKLVEALAPERDPSRTPLFQVMLLLQQHASPRLDFGPGLSAAIAPLPNGTAKFDLELELEASPAGALAGHVGYATDLFFAATMRRLAGHLETLLAAAVEDPSLPLSTLPLLTAAERAQLAEWRAEGWQPRPAPGQEASGLAGAAAPPGRCLHQLFAAQAARTPAAPALVAGRERLSYAELAARAGRLARRLRACGIGPEAGVGLLLERSATLVVAMLATLEAGGYYVPLDPAYPDERLAFLAADSGARVVIAAPHLLPRAAKLAADGIRVLAGEGEGESEGDEEAAVGAPAPAPAPLPANLAYLIYTSGSTGLPKAVAIAHHGAVQLADWARQTFGREELAGVLASTSIAFDLSVFEVFVPLAWGGTVILSDHVFALRDLPAAGEVTLIDTVPSLMAELLRGGPLPPSVRTVTLAGEPLSRALAERIHALPDPPRLYNLYGPSEDTTFSTWSEVAPLAGGAHGAPTIGRAIPGSWASVLDAALREVPIGVPGELCLGGAGLARGYLGAPELTAERFVSDPCATTPGERLHRTGDVARLLPDGSLELFGRRDTQVKVRGFRIDLGEIESALAACAGVEAAAVLAPAAGAPDATAAAPSPGESGERRLVAYVAPAGLPVAELREALRRRLPDYMVPAVWVCLPALPLTATGKVDRRALPPPEPARPDLAPAFLAPRDATEAALAEVWCEVLRRHPVGVHDNFFDLGGDSILAIQVVARCRRHGLALEPRQLFRHPTVAALALVAAPTPAEPAEPAAPAPPATATAAADFSLAGLSAEDLDELLGELTPVQGAS